MMGGRVAEELKFGKDNITSGASSDIEQATKLARAMVTRWGFSDELGKVTYGESQEDMYLQGGGRNQQVSEETARVIDSEIRRLIDEAYQTAKQTLTSKKKQWVALAEGLLEYETLTGSEIQEVINGKPPSRDMGKDSPTPHVSSVPKAGKTPEKPKADHSKSVVVRAKTVSNPSDKVDEKQEASDSDKSETAKTTAEKKPAKTTGTTKTSKSEKSEKPVKTVEKPTKKSAETETGTDNTDDKKA